MEIRAGLTYLQYLCQLIGFVDKPVLERAVDNTSWESGDVRGKLASKVFQIFFVATDGSMCIPLGFVPSDTISGEKAFDTIKPIIEKFEQRGIKIEWGSSDGFSTNAKLIALMEKNNIEYLHIFDPSHFLKNLRSILEDFAIVTDTCPGGFSMKTLDNLRRNNPNYAALLPGTLFPTDRMDIDHYKCLVKDDLLKLLEKETGEAEKGLFEFLKNMGNLHKGFLNNGLPFPERKEKLDQAELYFRKLSKKAENQKKAPITVNLAFQITSSVKNLTKLQARHPTTFRPSVYGTLIVENFFSIIRRKVRYPSLAEYACVYSHALEEL